MPHNRGLNNKCFDDCMCAEGEPDSPQEAGGAGGNPSCSEAGSARSRDTIPWRRWPEGPAAMEGWENPLGAAAMSKKSFARCLPNL